MTKPPSTSTTIVWWISDDALARGGRRLLGPFESRELALRVREHYEKSLGRPGAFWVDDCPVRADRTP